MKQNLNTIGNRRRSVSQTVGSPRKTSVWTREKINQLIELYKQHSCLWNHWDESYKNKEKRNRAIEHICSILSISKFDFGKKIHNLRNQFNSEMKKLEQRLEAGGGLIDYNNERLECGGETNGDESKPLLRCKWGHFKSLMFLRDVIEPRPGGYQSVFQNSKRLRLKIDYSSEIDESENYSQVNGVGDQQTSCSNNNNSGNRIINNNNLTSSSTVIGTGVGSRLVIVNGGGGGGGQSSLLELNDPNQIQTTLQFDEEEEEESEPEPKRQRRRQRQRGEGSVSIAEEVVMEEDEEEEVVDNHQIIVEGYHHHHNHHQTTTTFTTNDDCLTPVSSNHSNTTTTAVGMDPLSNNNPNDHRTTMELYDMTTSTSTLTTTTNLIPIITNTNATTIGGGLTTNSLMMTGNCTTTNATNSMMPFTSPPMATHPHPIMPKVRDQWDTFGDLIASEFRHLNSDISRKKLKRKIMQAMLEVGEADDKLPQQN